MEKISLDAKNPETIKEEIERLIYIGPNIPGGVLHRYQVFKGGIPEYLNDIKKKCPAIQGLFVPVEKFTVAEQSLSFTGSAENTLFQAVVDHFKGGK